MEATIIMARCLKNKKLFGMRVQKMEDNDWWRTWAFEVDERRAAKEGYQATAVEGNLYALDSYPGCPYCGAKEFVRCGTCGRLTCWNQEDKYVCAWCGNSGDVTPATEKFHLQDIGDL